MALGVPILKHFSGNFKLMNTLHFSCVSFTIATVELPAVVLSTLAERCFDDVTLTLV